MFLQPVKAVKVAKAIARFDLVESSPWRSSSAHITPTEMQFEINMLIVHKL
jgi:hypothetical protein